MDADSLLGLAKHMAWADATVWTSALASSGARADSRLQTTFHHIHLVQHIFGAAWRGSPAAVRSVTDFGTPEDLARWAGCPSLDRGLPRCHTRARLDVEFREPWTAEFEAYLARPAASHTLGESILQAILHSLHHRGQLCVRLRELEVMPPTVDFIVWLWAGRRRQTGPRSNPVTLPVEDDRAAEELLRLTCEEAIRFLANLRTSRQQRLAAGTAGDAAAARRWAGSGAGVVLRDLRPVADWQRRTALLRVRHRGHDDRCTCWRLAHLDLRSERRGSSHAAAHIEEFGRRDVAGIYYSCHRSSADDLSLARR